MSDKVFIDTNILLYAYDRDAGVKHEIARELIRHRWEDTSGVISIQVLSEFFVRATRTGILSSALTKPNPSYKTSLMPGR